MDGITTAGGWTIAKVEIEMNGIRTEVPAPYNFTPAEIGTIRIIITISDGSKTVEFCSAELSVKPLEYQAVIPAKAESMYQKFNTTNDRAYERW